MRTKEDLVRIMVSSYSIIDLDWERIEEDPEWSMVSSAFDLNDQEQKMQALFRYLGNYVSRDQLFKATFMPSTNGPANLIITDMEDVTNGYRNNNGT